MTLSFVRRGVATCTLALLVVIPALVQSQTGTGTVRGKITDAASGRGLPQVQVTIAGTRVGALTGETGEYTLTAIPAGPRTVTARRGSTPETWHPWTRRAISSWSIARRT